MPTDPCCADCCHSKGLSVLLTPHDPSSFLPFFKYLPNPIPTIRGAKEKEKGKKGENTNVKTIREKEVKFFFFLISHGGGNCQTARGLSCSKEHEQGHVRQFKRGKEGRKGPRTGIFDFFPQPPS